MKQPHVLNRREHPRVLVQLPLHLRRRFEFIDSLPGTYRDIASLSEVELSEWDALITNTPLARRPQRSTSALGSELLLGHNTRIVPEHLCVFTIFDDVARAATVDQVDGTDPDASPIWLQQVGQIPGHEVHTTGYIPERLDNLVKRTLIPVVEQRNYQFGGRLSREPVENFHIHLRGPQALILAANYRRPDGASVWVVPHDLPDFEPWFEEALHDWHEIHPDRFPGLPRWTESAEWMTHEERVIADEIRTEEANFARIAGEYEARLNVLTEQLSAAREAADAGERILLTGQDKALEDAVCKALRNFGYEVAEMDEKWDERERREDYRITDPGCEGWLVIADATGVAKGAKGGKLQILGGHVEAYLFEERPSVRPRRWLLVNREIEKDPHTRHKDIFRSDVLGPFADSQGLAIDTPALFVLDNATKSGGISPEAVRDLLRERTGQVTLQCAQEWIESQRTVPGEGQRSKT